MSTVRTEIHGPVLVVTIDRPEVRNAVDRPTAEALSDAFRSFDADADLAVAILTGSGGYFCAGADLKALATDPATTNRAHPEGDAPMGPTRMTLTKPVIAAIEGYCTAGGMELAIWCDLRVAAEDATLGIFNRRWGVPLLDGGAVRLARLIGQSRAMDLVLTGRPVAAREALDIGLANRVVPRGEALDAALSLASELAAFPQSAMRAARATMLEQWNLSLDDALRDEFRRGVEGLSLEEARKGAERFAGGKGRHGDFSDI